MPKAIGIEPELTHGVAVAAELPFPDNGRKVSCFLERIRKGALIGQHACNIIAVRAFFHAISEGIASGKKSRAGWRTDRMDVEICQTDAFMGESIEMRRGNRTAVKTGMMPVHIIGEYDQDVGWLFRRGPGGP